MSARQAKRTEPILVAALLVVLGFAQGAFAQSLPSNLYDGMKWRLVGPFRGGRAEAVAGIPGNPNVLDPAGVPNLNPNSSVESCSNTHSSA